MEITPLEGDNLFSGGPLQLKPEQKLVSACFNLDNGTGKVRGVYLQGNALVVPIFQKWMEP
jgi:hypothetical protein